MCKKSIFIYISISNAEITFSLRHVYHFIQVLHWQNLSFDLRTYLYHHIKEQHCRSPILLKACIKIVNFCYQYCNEYILTRNPEYFCLNILNLFKTFMLKDQWRTFSCTFLVIVHHGWSNWQLTHKHLYYGLERQFKIWVALHEPVMAKCKASRKW